MTQIVFSPDEKVILSDKASIEQPVSGSGILYLTNKRLVLIHVKGLIRKRETPLISARLDEIEYARVEGLLRKVLIIGVKTGAIVQALKIKVKNPEAWVAQIYALKSGTT